MTKLLIVEDNQFFTAGISHAPNGFVPFFQNHETEDDFEEEIALETEQMAFLRLAEIIIEKLDGILAEDEDCESECDVNVSKIGDNPQHTQE